MSSKSRVKEVLKKKLLNGWALKKHIETNLFLGGP